MDRTFTVIAAIMSFLGTRAGAAGRRLGSLTNQRWLGAITPLGGLAWSGGVKYRSLI